MMRTTVVFLIAAYALGSVLSQPLIDSQGIDVASEGVLVPEIQPVGVPQAAPAAALATPELAATTVSVKHNNRAQAARAWGRAKPWRPLLENRTDTGPIGTESICGVNSLVADNSITNCRILSRYGNNYFTCSAFKIGERLLGTAGHCVYTKPNGGWATAVDVYCTGATTCGGARTTYATHLTTTASWMASVTTIPTAWDGAVIRTAEPLPGPEFKLAQYAQQGAYSVRLTGYPALNDDPGCEGSAYAGACRQYSSTDTMQVTSSGMYSSSNLDLCRGHSGSGVMTADASRYITAIVTGASLSPCANYFVPQVNSNSGINGDCEKPEGGVSLACLAAKLPA